MIRLAPSENGLRFTSEGCWRRNFFLLGRHVRARAAKEALALRFSRPWPSRPPEGTPALHPPLPVPTVSPPHPFPPPPPPLAHITTPIPSRDTPFPQRNNDNKPPLLLHSLPFPHIYPFTQPSSSPLLFPHTPSLPSPLPVTALSFRAVSVRVSLEVASTSSAGAFRRVVLTHGYCHSRPSAPGATA